jgi:hypothetical protein
LDVKRSPDIAQTNHSHSSSVLFPLRAREEKENVQHPSERKCKRFSAEISFEAKSSLFIFLPQEVDSDSDSNSAKLSSGGEQFQHCGQAFAAGAIQGNSDFALGQMTQIRSRLDDKRRSAEENEAKRQQQLADWAAQHQQALNGMLSVGTRAPVSGFPVWATPEVSCLVQFSHP